MKVSELTGPMLDLFVGMSDGRHVRLIPGIGCVEYHISGKKSIGKIKNHYSPSQYWDRGGLIIEREGIQLVPGANGEQWAAGIDEFVQGGDTPLIAAMRCFVASKFGEEVPDEPAS